MDRLVVGIDLAVDPPEVVLERLDLVFHLEQGETETGHDDQRKECRCADQAAISPIRPSRRWGSLSLAGHGGAAVRSATRSLAERARGFRDNSADPAVIGFLEISVKLGARFSVETGGR